MIKQIIIEVFAGVLGVDIEEYSLIALFLADNCFGISLENIDAGILLVMDLDCSCRLVLQLRMVIRSYRVIEVVADIASAARVDVDRTFRRD